MRGKHEPQPEKRGIKRFSETDIEPPERQASVKRHADSNNKLALRHMSVPELRGVLAQSSSCSMITYRNLIKELSVRLKDNSASQNWTDLVDIALTLFNNSFPLWSKSKTFENDEPQVIEDATHIAYYLGVISLSAGSKTLSHSAITGLVHYVAKRATSYLSRCLYGIGALAKSKKLSGCFAGQDINSLLRQLTRCRPINNSMIFSSLMGLNWLCTNQRLSGWLSAELFENLLVQLKKQKAVPLNDINSIILFLGNMALTGSIVGRIKTKNVLALFPLDRIQSTPNLNVMDIVNILPGISKLVSASAVDGLINEAWCSSWVSLCARKAEVNAISGRNISYIFHHLSVLIQQHPQPNKLFKLELTPLLQQMLKSLQDVQDSPPDAQVLERTVAALIGLKLYTKIDTSALFSCIDLLLNKHFCLDRLASYLSYFVAFKDQANALNPLFKTFLVRLPLRLRECSSQMQHDIHKAMAELKRTPWGTALQQRFGFNSPKAGAIQNLTLTASSSLVIKSASTIKAGVSLSHKIVDKAWDNACKNEIFFAILSDDLPSLKALLGTSSKSVSKRTVDVANKLSSELTRENNRVRTSSDSRLQKRNELTTVDGLTISFLNTEEKQLRRLIKSSKAIYFTALLHACSQHTRYQLAKEGKLDSVVLYLPFSELKLFIDGLIEPNGVGICVDSESLFHLIDALYERSTKCSLEQKKELYGLQQSMLKRAKKTHQSHRYVLTDIDVALVTVGAALVKVKSELTVLRVKAEEAMTPASKVGFFKVETGMAKQSSFITHIQTRKPH